MQELEENAGEAGLIPGMGSSPGVGSESLTVAQVNLMRFKCGCADSRTSAVNHCGTLLCGLLVVVFFFLFYLPKRENCY